MTALAEIIGQELSKRGWQQRQLAHEWQATVGEGKVSTYETRLSKLLNDDSEGYEFLFAEKGERLAGLAAVLGRETGELRRICEVDMRRPTLVLDPRLPDSQRAFFRSHGGETYAVVEPNPIEGQSPVTGQSNP